jgi:hypothetical protein
MRVIKTYEGFFDFFKKSSSDSEDDKIALEYINRLKKVKDISPYSITKDDEVYQEFGYSILRYNVNFDDTPIRCTKVVSHRPIGFDESSQEILTNRGGIKKNDKEFYSLSAKVEEERESIKAKVSIIDDLYHLIEDVYKKDKEARRIQRIKSNLNKAADLLDDDEKNI